MPQLFSVDEVGALLRLQQELREIGTDPLRRKRHMLVELGRLTNSSVGLCLVGENRERKQSTYTSIVQSGWVDHEIPEPMDEYLQYGKPSSPLIATLRKNLRRGTTKTIWGTRQDFVTDQDWYESDYVQQVMRPCCLDDCIVSMLPLAPTKLIAFLVFSRNVDAEPFESRHAQLVNLFHEQSAWIYQADLPFASPEVNSLSPRQREIFQYLMNGGSEKQIAAQIHRSRNTVHHYVKSLYKHFGVSSRSELLMRWMKNIPAGEESMDGYAEMAKR